MVALTKIAKTDLADGALYDKVNDMADALNGAKVEGPQLGIRKASTAYSVGAIRYCEYHPEFFLKCTTSGTSGTGSLDTSGALSVGQTITDGSVVWTVTKVGAVQSVNGVQPDATTGNVQLPTELPSQTGQNGKYLKTDGTAPSWDTVVSTTITYWE